MTKDNHLTDHYLHSLNRNIILIIIIVSIIPLLLVSITIYGQFRASYHEKVYDHLRELVQSHSQNIDNYLQEKLSDIRFLTDSCGWENLADEPFLQERLAVLQKDFGQDFVDIGVVTALGEQIAYAGPFKLGKADYSNAEWFRKSIQSEYFISDVFLGLRGLPHFIIAVRNNLGNGHWILRATIDFVAFTTLVENIRLGQTGFAFILNKEGKLQTTPMARPTMGSIDSKTLYEEFYAKSHVFPGKIRITTKSYNSQDKNIYIAAPIKNGDWLFVYQQRMADAFADLRKTFMMTTALMFVGVIGIIIMAFTLSKMIIGRVAKADSEKQMMSKKVVETGKLASVGELAAGIAHEINNPVAIMVEEAGWMGDLLEEEEFEKSENTDEFERAIAQIKTQGKRCKEITHKLLSFARKTDTTVEDVNINELLEELVALASQRAKYGMVEIETDFQQNLPSLRASISELQQVVFNLINNAIDAMGHDGGTLTISSHQRGNDLTIVVSDTGEGIPEANLDRIFDPFFTTKPVGKGTGLGLSICYGIIEKMGGKLEVSSTVGTGTTFSISLPFQTDSDRQPEVIENPELMKK
ncbi:MAG: two-component sensor histidine kinase [Deltaproteobacteria bacterium]|nr:MAG: two-component sensor histidine kinase [Deltaproteobacteria bacterium]